MEGIPVLYVNREMSFDQETLDKLRYLNYKAGKQSFNLKERFSDIVNQALQDFFTKEFPKLKIEYYIDEAEEYSKKRHKEMLEENARQKENIRLALLAKKRIMEREIEAIKKEEKESGKKYELPVDIYRILSNYKI